MISTFSHGERPALVHLRRAEAQSIWCSDESWAWHGPELEAVVWEHGMQVMS